MVSKMSKDISILMKQIGVAPTHSRLILEAMTHKSYSTEHGLSYDNQRFEFLGDAVMQIILTEYLFMRYPSEQEGKLTKMRSALARQSSFAKLAYALHLQDFIRMGKGEIASGGDTRISTLCDAFEALVGAIYMASGLSPVVEIVIPLLKKHFEDPAALLDDLNPKGMLQEYTQKYCKSERPEYVISMKKGPDHDCEYEIEVAVKEKVIGRGTGKSRKSAEMAAASNALKALKQLFEGQ